MKYLVKNIKYLLFVICCLFIVSAKVYALPTDEIVYKLYTDSAGTRWQYAYNDDTTVSGAEPTEKWVQIAFFDKQEVVTNITVPSLDTLKSYDSEIGSDVATLKLINYTDQDLGTPYESSTDITKLELRNVDYILGVSPMINSDVETEVVFSNSAKTHIGANAFSSKKLKLVNIDKILTIGNNAFENSTFNNTNINLTALSQIGDGAFWGTNLTSVSINVENIHYNAFRNCKNLKTVTLGNNVTKINDAAFRDDDKLDTINFNNVTYIGNYAFSDATSFNIDISNTKFTHIGDAAFNNTTGLTRALKIPDGVTEIRWGTFYNSGITSIDFNNVTEIGMDAFTNCSNLTDIDFSEVTKIGAKAFKNCTNLSNIDFSKVKYIEHQAFYGDTSLTKVEFTDSVIKVWTEAFSNCSIEELDLNKVQYIHWHAFYNNNLTELYLPKTLYIRGPELFENNPVTKVTIAYDTMTKNMNPYAYEQEFLFKYVIGYYASDTITDIELIAPYAENEEISFNSEFNITRGSSSEARVSGDNLDRLIGKEDNYKNVLKPNYFYDMRNLKNLKIGEGYEFLGAHSIFTGYHKKLEKVELPSTLKGIGTRAFLESLIGDVDIELPQSLEYIGNHAFFRCTGYKGELNLKNLKYLGTNSFEESGITKVYFHDKLEFVGTNAILRAKNLKEIIFDVDIYSLPNTGDNWAETIEEWNNSTRIIYTSQNFFTVFAYSDNNREFDLIKFTDKVVTEPFQNGFKTSGYYFTSFFYKIKAEEIDISETGWKSIGETMFLKAEIGELKLPKNLEYIGKNAFQEAKIDNEIELPNTIKEIESHSFLSANLKTSQLSTDLEKIGQAAFYNTDFNANPIVPNGVIYIGQSAFGADSNRNIVRDTFTFDCDLPSSVMDPQRYSQFPNTINAITYNTTIKKLILTENVKHLPTNTYGNNSYSGVYASEFAKMKMEEVVIEGVEVIPKLAFVDNKNLKIVDLSKDTNLKEIKDHAFYNAEELSKIIFPGDATQEIKVGYSAFRHNGYTSIGVTDEDGINLTSAKFILEDSTLGDTFVFADNNQLKEVVIPNGFNNNNIPAFTFTRSANLEKVIVNDEIEKIGKYAFAEDVNLESIFIWGNTEIERINNVVDVTKPKAIVVYDHTDGLKYDFEIKKDDEVVSTMNFNPETNLTRAVTYKVYPYDGNGDITFDYPGTVIIDMIETNDAYVVNVKEIDPDNFTIPSSADIYAYSNHDAAEYEEEYSKYRQNEDLDTNSEILYFDEVIALAVNKSVVKYNGVDDDFDKDGLIVYGLRRDGVVIASSNWGELTDTYMVTDLPGNIKFKGYTEDSEDKYDRIYLIPYEEEKVDTSTENFENIDFGFRPTDKEDYKYIDINYTNTFVENDVNAILLEEQPIKVPNTLDNIGKSITIFVISLLVIVLVAGFYFMNKKKSKESEDEKSDE